MTPPNESDPSATPTPAPLQTPLSDTEDQILRQVATGATNREIARERGITEATVKKHLTNINAKLGTSNRTEATRRALELGLVTVETPERPDQDAARGEMTRRLAEELERHRRGSLRARRAVVALAVVALLAAGGGYGVAAWRGAGPATPTPARSAAVEGVFWVPNKPLPAPRAGLALATLGGETFAIGGDDGSGPVATTLRYPDRFDVDWAPRRPKPTAVRDIAAVAVRGAIVVPGGCAADGAAVAVVEAYDPRADAWTALPDLPEPLCGYGLAELDGQVYLLGGRAGPDPATATSLILRYEPGDPAWTTLEDRLPDRRADLAAVAVADDGVIHVVGGRDVDGGAERSHWIYRPYVDAPAERWTTTGLAQLPDARAGHAAVVAAAPTARLYVVGGGWDARPEPAALAFDLVGDEGWVAAGEVRGHTPWRGAALTVRERGELLLAGGEADGAPLAQSYSLPLLSRIFVP